MNERQRVILLISIMVVVVLTVGLLAVGVSYLAAFDETKKHLEVAVASQVALIEAVSTFDALHAQKSPGMFPQGPKQASLGQVLAAHESYGGFGRTGEFVLAKKQGDQIAFLVRHRHGEVDQPTPIPFGSALAEPMRLALSKKSGTIVGSDYRGEKVLAAYAFSKSLDLGVVTKIDLSELRSPFVRAGALSMGVGGILILIGALLFFKVTQPIISKTEAQAKKSAALAESLQISETRLRNIIETNRDAILVLDRDGRVVFANHAAVIMFNRFDDDIYGYAPGLTIQNNGAFELALTDTHGQPKHVDVRTVDLDWKGNLPFWPRYGTLLTEKSPNTAYSI